MASGKTTVPASEMAKDLSIEVELTGLQTWKLRCAMGIVFIRLGIWITGMDGKITGPVEKKRGFKEVAVLLLILLATCTRAQAIEFRTAAESAKFSAMNESTGFYKKRHDALVLMQTMINQACRQGKFVAAVDFVPGDEMDPEYVAAFFKNLGYQVIVAEKMSSPYTVQVLASWAGKP